MEAVNSGALSNRHANLRLLSRKASGFKAPLLNATALLVTAGLLWWAADNLTAVVWRIIAPDSSVLMSRNVMAESLSTSGNLMSQGQQSSSLDMERLQSVFVLSPAGLVSSGSTSDTSGQLTETRLALTLKAAVQSSDAAFSRAIIASGESQQFYKPGDTLLNTPGTVVLQAVYQNYVTLDNNGYPEVLRLDALDRLNSQAESGAVVSSAAISPTASSVSVDSNQLVNQNQAFNQHQLVDQSLSQRPLTELIRLLPVFGSSANGAPGALKGLQIRHGSRQDFLAAAGLKQGDIITAVNGTPMTDMLLNNSASLPALMEQLSSLGHASLDVIRDEQALKVQLDRSRLF